MPGPGDQHKDNLATINPFEDNPPRINEYTAQEIATLQCRLDKQLGPEFISSRQGPGGGKLHYIAADKVINLANEVFGFNGWSSQIRNVQIDFVDEDPTSRRVSLGLSIVVRVTLRDGTYHEDIGYGMIENCKGKAPAFEKAKKEAVTDALKRALRNFGNVLGNCLYDKDYLSRVTKVKVAASKWDAENLHRHPDFMPPKREEPRPKTEQNITAVPNEDSAGLNIGEFEDEFGGDLVGEVDIVNGYSDAVMLPPSRHPSPRPAPVRNVAGPSPQQHNQQGQPAVTPRNIQASNGSAGTSGPGDSKAPPSLAPPLNNNKSNPLLPNHSNNQPQPTNQHSNSHSTPPNQPHPTSLPQQPHQPHQAQGNNNGGQPPQQHRPHEPPVGFITSRAAEALTGQDPAKVHLADLPRFDPNAESPSIRKTSGVNHATSAPVSKAVISGGAAPANPTPQPGNMPAPARPMTSNYVNPSESIQRKIGAPGAGSPSPMANRSSYKPPSVVNTGVKRPYVASGPEGSHSPRPALADLSNVSGQAGAGSSNGADGEEAKRARMAES